MDKIYFIANWFFSVLDSSSGFNYRFFKNNFCFEQYLVSLPLKQRKLFIQIRTRNHRLPIETGGWKKYLIRGDYVIYAKLKSEMSFIMYLFVGN